MHRWRQVRGQRLNVRAIVEAQGVVGRVIVIEHDVRAVSRLAGGEIVLDLGVNVSAALLRTSLGRAKLLYPSKIPEATAGLERIDLRSRDVVKCDHFCHLSLGIWSTPGPIIRSALPSPANLTPACRNNQQTIHLITISPFLHPFVRYGRVASRMLEHGSVSVSRDNLIKHTCTVLCFLPKFIAISLVVAWPTSRKNMITSLLADMRPSRY